MLQHLDLSPRLLLYTQTLRQQSHHQVFVRIKLQEFSAILVLSDQFTVWLLLPHKPKLRVA
jgi:hypothetical protein